MGGEWGYNKICVQPDEGKCSYSHNWVKVTAINFYQLVHSNTFI